VSYKFACRDAGHACRWQAKADSEEELKARVADHVSKVHKVSVTTDTIWNFVRGRIKQT
jgi:predicted small metal-binding protein